MSLKPVTDPELDDLVYYRGSGIQSGTYKGKADLFAHLGVFAKCRDSTFAIDQVEYITGNGDLVAAAIHFKAQKGDHALFMKGIDLLRIEQDFDPILVPVKRVLRYQRSGLT